MNVFSDELRLAWVALLNIGLFVAAYRFARRLGNLGIVQAVCDSLLIYFLVQYAAVALPGVVGHFTAASMTAVAIIAAVGLWFAGGNTSPSPETKALSSDHFILFAAALFVVGFLIRYAKNEWPIPPVATDALVYHLPTAVQWMQTGRLGIYPTWYWNPAASYSPMTGSTFMAWWMFPLRSDVLVRFVQLPPLIFIFFLVARMCRLVGSTRAIAGLIGVAATLSRPLFSEVNIPKDDLYVTSFIAAAIVSLAREPMEDRLGPWRLGVAMGFVLASKYTALLACPVFLFMIDSPFRAGWKPRHWIIAITCASVMALPWYVRNYLLTGNPLYPVDVHLLGLKFPGLFSVERDQQLRTMSGIQTMLAGTYHSLPLPIIVTLCIGWVAALIAGGRRIVTNPLIRTATVGSVATFILFLITSPHHEVRYIFPLLVLWFVAIGIALGTRFKNVGLTVAGAIAIVSIVTVFKVNYIGLTLMFAAGAAVITVMGLAYVWIHRLILAGHCSRLAMVLVVAAAVFAIADYIYWRASLVQYEHTRFEAWEHPDAYPNVAPIWTWVNANVPQDATIAYANTFFVYPYYGEHFTRGVAYAPARKGFHDFSHFPRMGDHVPGDLIVARMTQVMNEKPDLQTWVDNLHAIGAHYLVIVRDDPTSPALSTNPPELNLAKANPAIFIALEQNEAGWVFKIK